MSEILTGYAAIEDAPETEQKFLKQGEDGKIYYQNDGLLATLEAQRKAEREAKTEAERLKAQLEALKTEAQRAADQKQTEKPKDEPKETAEMMILKKRIETIEAERQREQLENKRLKLDQIKQQAAERAGIRPEAVKMYNDDFAVDEKGQVFIKDMDGTPKINPVTGQRMTPEEFFTSEAKSKRWIAKDAGAGAGFTGSAGYQQRATATATEIRDLKTSYKEALKSGDTRTLKEITNTARSRGINLS